MIDPSLSTSSINIGKSKILIVEDNPVARIVLLQDLKDHYEIRAVENGFQAITAVSQEIPDLILMDVSLPEMDGFETLKKLYEGPLPRDVPVIYLTGRMEIEDKVKGLRIGAIDYIIKPYYREELEFRIKVHIERFLLRRELKRQNIALQEELVMASLLQKSLLPESLPKTDILSLHSFYRPLNKLSGDLFDAFWFDNKTLYFLVADVSGHGVRSAMMMAMFKVLYIEGIRRNPSPAALFKYMNTELDSLLPVGEFITAFLGVLDIETLKLQFVNAGHPSPIIYSRKEKKCESLDQRCNALGIKSDQYYVTSNIALHSEDIFLIYTDGICESFNLYKEAFGKERLMESLVHSSSLEPEKICPHIIEELTIFTGPGEQEDDITMLILAIS